MKRRKRRPKIENRHVGKVLFVDTGKPIVVSGQGMLKIARQ